MDYDKFDGLEVRVPRDDSYRTCSVCHGDCVPEASGADGHWTPGSVYL